MTLTPSWQAWLVACLLATCCCFTSAAWDGTTIPSMFDPFSTLLCYAWDDTLTISDDGSGGTPVPIITKASIGGSLVRDNLTLQEVAEYMVGADLLASGAVTVQNVSLSSHTNCGQIAVVNFAEGKSCQGP